MNLHFILKWTHVAAGAFALIAGLIAMLSSKKKGNHTTWGKLYFLSMCVVFASSIFLCFKINSLILLVIGLFSFQMAASGYRSLVQMKKGFTVLYLTDHLILIYGAISTLLLGALGVRIIPQTLFGLVLLIFASISALNTLNFFKSTRSKQLNDKLRAHIGFMCGSYIAAFTAFLVNNGNWFPLPPWLLWLLPTLIGTPLIVYTIRKIPQNRKDQN